MKVVRSAGSGWRCHGMVLLPLLAVLACLFHAPAQAQRIENRVANFAALDKVTAVVKQLPVDLNETGTFRNLKITPRVCYTRDPSQPPRTSTFVQIDEVLVDGTEKRIFSGWMFAESPGLNPLVHPVYDLWLTGCSKPEGPATARRPDATDPSASSAEAPPPRRRRRVPR